MFYVITRRATPDVVISLLFIRYEINPHSWLFLLAARQSVQAPSALAPQRRFPQSLRSFGMTDLQYIYSSTKKGLPSLAAPKMCIE